MASVYLCLRVTKSCRPVLNQQNFPASFFLSFPKIKQQVGQFNCSCCISSYVSLGYAKFELTCFYHTIGKGCWHMQYNTIVPCNIEWHAQPASEGRDVTPMGWKTIAVCLQDGPYVPLKEIVQHAPGARKCDHGIKQTINCKWCLEKHISLHSYGWLRIHQSIIYFSLIDGWPLHMQITLI